MLRSWRLEDEWLEGGKLQAPQYGSGRLRSIQQVGDELSAGQDDLANWANGLDEGFFLPPDAAVLAAAQRVSAWVLQQGYEPAAVNTFLQVADFWLVAAALAGQHTLVTHEVASPTAKRIKIPNVCVGLGVAFMSPYLMLRSKRARFILAPV